jgi:hypothetical protein
MVSLRNSDEGLGRMASSRPSKRLDAASAAPTPMSCSIACLVLFTKAAMRVNERQAAAQLQ